MFKTVDMEMPFMMISGMGHSWPRWILEGEICSQILYFGCLDLLQPLDLLCTYLFGQCLWPHQTLTGASMGLRLHFHGESSTHSGFIGPFSGRTGGQAGAHSPAQWNCPKSSQESRWRKCPQWQDRGWPSELLLQPTGYQRGPQPGLASAPACLLHINYRKEVGWENLGVDCHLGECWGRHFCELFWIQGGSVWFLHQPALKECPGGPCPLCCNWNWCPHSTCCFSW